MQTLIRDAAYALKGFRRQTVFTLTAVLSIALGIGANTAMFSVAGAVLLNPLPYKGSERLVILWNRSPGLNIAEDWFSTAQYFDIRRGHSGFEQLAIAIGANYNLTGNGEPERVGVLRASSNLLLTFGAAVERGRLLVGADDAPGQEPNAVISYGAWERHFGRKEVLGHTLQLNGKPYLIVGVLARSFSLPHEVLPTLGGAEAVDVVVPLPLTPAAANDRGHEDYNIVGRLRPGVTVQEARAQMDVITSRLRRDHPDLYPPNGGLTFDIVPLREQVAGNARQPILLLGCAVGLVLLIACANVASLQLSRSVARHKEIAVRMALGAGRAQVVRIIMAENVLLGLMGGAAGLLLAFLCMAEMRAVGQGSIPRLAEIGLSAPVVLFTLVVSLGTGVVFGIAPAVRLSGTELSESLKDAARGTSGSGFAARGQRLLVAVQVALCTVVLSASGLLVRSYAARIQVYPGFDPRDVLTFGLTMAGTKYNKAPAVIETYRQLSMRLEKLPGTAYAGAVSALPLSQNYSWGPITIEGRIPTAGESFINADERIVEGHYFEAMKIPLRRGRLFNEDDLPDSARVALIDETMAREFWPRQDPVGKRFHNGGLSVDKPWITIVGVVGTVRQYSLESDSRIAIYFPQTQAPAREMSVVAGSRALNGAGVTALVHNLDSDLPIYDMKPMTARVADSLGRARFALFLFSTFGGLALILAMVGAYGLMAYTVNRSVREIGIRIALGATGQKICLLVLARGLSVAASGILCGILCALGAMRFLRSLLFAVGASDPLTMVSVTLLLFMVSACACYMPALRASRVEATACLRAGD